MAQTVLQARAHGLDGNKTIELQASALQLMQGKYRREIRPILYLSIITLQGPIFLLIDPTASSGGQLMTIAIAVPCSLEKCSGDRGPTRLFQGFYR